MDILQNDNKLFLALLYKLHTLFNRDSLTMTKIQIVANLEEKS